MSKKNIKKEEASSQITTKNGIFDYSQCLFEVRLTKKGFLGQSTRYVYCTKNSIVVAKEPYQKKPDKIINLKPDWQVAWIYDAKKIKEPFEKKILGFKLITDTDVKIEYFGDVVVMTTLRDYFCKQLFQIKFLDEFEIQKKIGKGKYAKVYKVRRKDNNQLYAVKYLHKMKLATIEDAQAALFNELKILRLIDHPNCIKLIATYEDNNGYYILTELLDSEKSLQGELTKFQNPQFGYQVVRHILKQLIKGIEYVHSLGIMHRDLKPQNIMFANNDSSSLSNLKIIDFGLAQFINDPNYIYVHVGTPGYVAPEILANESEKHRYTEKCDLFSIGVVFHILLTGRSVFPGKKFSQVLQSNKECKIDLRGPKYDELNKDAIDLLGKLLEPNPLKRPSAAEALLHKFFFPDTQKENNKVSSAVNLDQTANSVSTNVTNKDKEMETPLKFGGKLAKGFHNLNKITSVKDIDNIPFNFDDIQQKLQNQASMYTICKQKDDAQKQSLYKLAQELVDLFIILEENQTDDLSFFASPLKIRGGLRNSMADGSLLQKFGSFDQEDEQNPQKSNVILQEVKEEEEFPQAKNNQQNENQQQDLKNENGGRAAMRPAKLKIESLNHEEEEEQKDIVTDMTPVRVSKNELNIIIEKEDGTKKQLPKRLLKLLSFFPPFLFETELEGDLKKEGKQTVKILGKFLLQGNEYKKKLNDEQIQEFFQSIVKQNFLDDWFINLIQEMINPVMDLVPDFLYIKQSLDKNLQTPKK
ncbi:hypothetical protein ABPG74_018814 [Tetrahymena malaccensis]